MASVKQRQDSPYLVACFKLPNGKRKQVSAHTADPDEAMQIALTYERTSLMARKKRLNESTTRRVLQQIALAAGYENDAGLTIGEFLREQLAVQKQLYKGRTLERYRYALTHFRDQAGMTDQPLHQLSPARAMEWRDQLLAEGLAAATVNHQLAVLRAVFNTAVTKEWLERNPWEKVRMPRGRSRKQQRQAFTFAQFQALLDATAKEARAKEPKLAHAAEWHGLILLGGYSGQRRNDCVQLRGEQVNAKRGVLRFWRSKNNDWFEVPIHPVLRPLIVPLAKRNGHLFPHLAALPTTGRKSVTDIFRQRVLPLIKIVQPYEKGGQGRKIAPLSFHSLRHSLSSWLNEAGVSDADRRALVGHADAGVSLGYTHTGLADAQRAIERIPHAKRR